MSAAIKMEIKERGPQNLDGFAWLMIGNSGW
jgi:hypothetical protein